MGEYIFSNLNGLSFISNLFNHLISQEFWLRFSSSIFRVLIITSVSYIAMVASKKFIKRTFSLKKGSRFANQRTITLMKLAENTTIYAVYFFISIAFLESMGVSVTSLLTGAGILGLAIGFGAQNLVKDVITGFFIILEDQMAVSDYVSIGSYEGIVIDIGIRTTKVKSTTGEVHIIPNGSISSITNFSRYNSVAVVDLKVPLILDIDYVERIIKELLEELPERYGDIVATPKFLGVETFEEDNMIIRISAEVKPMTQSKIERIIRKEVKIKMDQKNLDKELLKLHDDI